MGGESSENRQRNIRRGTQPCRSESDRVLYKGEDCYQTYLWLLSYRKRNLLRCVPCFPGLNSVGGWRKLSISIDFDNQEVFYENFCIPQMLYG